LSFLGPKANTVVKIGETFANFSVIREDKEGPRERKGSYVPAVL
jgi:hypothetical protein